MAKSMKMRNRKARPYALCGASKLTPRKLYAAHYEWFSCQREQLSQFLALTAGKPRAVFSLPLPAGYTLPAAQGAAGQLNLQATTASKGKSSVSLSRAELLNLMREEINEFEANRLHSIKKFLVSTQVAKVTRERWEERLAGRRRMQLSCQVERLCKVYWCMARGITEACLISMSTGEERTTIDGYRLHLLNAVLGRLLVSPSTR